MARQITLKDARIRKIKLLNKNIVIMNEEEFARIIVSLAQEMINEIITSHKGITVEQIKDEVNDVKYPSVKLG